MEGEATKILSLSLTELIIIIIIIIGFAGLVQSFVLNLLYKLCSKSVYLSVPLLKLAKFNNLRTIGGIDVVESGLADESTLTPNA